MTTDVIACLERCCDIITAERRTSAARVDYVLRIDGGRFDGADFHCTTERTLLRLFDATRDALIAGLSPWWLQPIHAEEAGDPEGRPPFCRGDERIQFSGIDPAQRQLELLVAPDSLRTNSFVLDNISLSIHR